MSAQAQAAVAALHRVWTYDDLLALPDDGYRYEVLDGRIQVTPPPTPLHQFVLDQLAQLVRPLATAQGWVVYQGVGVRLAPVGGERYVVPDMVVVAGPRPAQYFEAAAVNVVVEVESPGSRLADRGTKRALYAEAGIGEYWLVDPRRRSVTCCVLDGGDYREAPGSPLLPALDWDALTGE